VRRPPRTGSDSLAKPTVGIEHAPPTGLCGLRFGSKLDGAGGRQVGHRLGCRLSASGRVGGGPGVYSAVLERAASC